MKYILALAALIPISALAQVTVHTTDNLQTLISANPAGTTFNFQAGTFTGVAATATSLKNNDVFNGHINGSGQKDTILDGAAVLPLSGNSWSQVTISSVVYWTTQGGTPNTSNSAFSGNCASGYPGCWLVQNLYFNSAAYVQVTSLANVTAGTWYYDTAGGDGGTVNNVYLTDDPNSETVELGSNTFAFQSSSATGITIQNLIIEKYAPDIQSGAVEAQASGWTINNNEIRLNHGSGIAASPGGNTLAVTNNYLHDNGQFGMNVGNINGATITGNTCTFNNRDHVNAGFGAGCSKFTGQNFTVSGNIVHDNFGPGMWTDVAGLNINYSNNQSYNNAGEGVRIEISNGSRVYNNTIYGNGLGNSAYGEAAAWQIAGASSSAVDVENNIIGIPAAVTGEFGGIQFSYNSARGGCGTGIGSGTYVSGITFTGTNTAGQTCTLTGFNHSNAAGIATVALTGTNTIASGTALVIVDPGTNSTSAATTATAGPGTATGCSGTATVSTVLENCTLPVNMLAKNNWIQAPAGQAVSMDDYSSTQGSWFVSGMFVTNTYCVPSLPYSGANWSYGEGNPPPHIGFAAWQADGQDVAGSMIVSASCQPPIRGVTMQNNIKFAGPISIAP